jgi:hypothetical protein
MLIVIGGVTLHGDSRHRRSETVTVGWNDEFNSSTNWKSFPVPNSPDISMPRRGSLRLRIGKGAVSSSGPFFWASAWRVAEVDSNRYPILAVNARNLKGPGWWDVVVQEWHDGRLIGQEMKTPSLDHAGVILFDLSKSIKPPKHAETHPGGTGEWTGVGEKTKEGRVQYRIRINIAGIKEGCSIEYAWLRFVRREDADRLSKNPRTQDIVVEP